MQRLIPTIYFYVLSAVGMGLFIFGLFNTAHYIVGITAYDKYPLRYGGEESRCLYMPRPILPEGAVQEESNLDSEKKQKEECLKNLEIERKNTKVSDLEKSITFTGIGLLVFSTHFYFARKQKNT